MPRIKLTDAMVKRLPLIEDRDKRQVEYTAADSPSGVQLILRLTRPKQDPEGAWSTAWEVRYRLDGNRRRFTLGSYGRNPERGQLTVNAALDQAFSVKASLRDGRDPHPVNKRHNTDPAQATDTVQALQEAREADLKRNGARDSYLNDMCRFFEKMVYPKYGDAKLEDVTKHDIKAMLEPLAAAGKARAYNLYLTYLSGLFSHSELDNPARSIKRMKVEPKRHFFTEDEARILYETLQLFETPGTPSTRLALLLAILTLKRANEVAGAKLSEFDLDNAIWTIPAERMKSKREDRVPLSSGAVEAVRQALTPAFRPNAERRKLYLFPMARDATRPMTSAGLGKAFERVRNAAGLTDNPATLHCLRRTGAAALKAHGIPMSTLSGLLSHTIIEDDRRGHATITEVYAVDTEAVLTERLRVERQALELWELIITQNLADDKVVRLGS